MNETSEKPTSANRFWPIIIVLVVMIVAGGIIASVLPYLREEWIIQKIEARGGRVSWHYIRPSLLPQIVWERLPNFRRITSIDLTEANETVLSELQSEILSLRELTDLDLNGDQITKGELAPLKALGLLTLFLHGTSDDDLKQLRDFKTLDCLHLSDNREITDHGIQQLSGLTNLTILGLLDLKITDAGIIHLKTLTRLKILILADTLITDVGLEHLKGLTNLTNINFENTQITDNGLGHLGELPNLVYLNLGRTKVTFAGFEHLKGRVNLRWLSLNGAQVTDDEIEKLKYFTKLRYVDLSDTRISDAGLERLTRMTSLEDLNLNNTQTTPEGRARLRKALSGCEILPDP